MRAEFICISLFIVLYSAVIDGNFDFCFYFSNLKKNAKMSNVYYISNNGKNKRKNQNSHQSRC